MRFFIGTLAAVAMLVAQICCAPPLRAETMHCPLKMKMPRCCKQQPEPDTSAVTPKPLPVAATVPRPMSVAFTPTRQSTLAPTPPLWPREVPTRTIELRI